MNPKPGGTDHFSRVQKQRSGSSNTRLRSFSAKRNPLNAVTRHPVHRNSKKISSGRLELENKGGLVKIENKSRIRTYFDLSLGTGPSNKFVSSFQSVPVSSVL